MVFWPKPEVIASAIAKNPEFEFPLVGAELQIEMKIDNQTVANICGALAFSQDEEFLDRPLKTLLPFQSNFRQKVTGNAPSLAKLQMLRGTNTIGDCAQLTFEVNDCYAKLVDVEIHTDLIDEPMFDATKVNFSLDVDNLDHMSGLVMAMEQKMATGELKDYDTEFNMINDHRTKLESAMLTGAEYQTAPKVHATVQQATHAMWKQIGPRITMKGTKAYMVEKLKAGWPLALETAKRLLRKMENVRTKIDNLKHA